MADRICVGFLVGNDTDRTIQFDQTGVVNLVGNNDADHVLRLLGGADFSSARLHLAPGYYRKALRWRTEGIEVIWNMVSDADQHPKTLDVIDEFTTRIGLPVIDPARGVLQTRRHQIAKRLAGIDNVHMPKTLLLHYPTLERVRRQVEEADFQFPAIVRRTGTHNGQMLGVFASPEEIAGVYGDRSQDYYLTEFVDFRWPDGLFRKTRFFFVGDEVVVRQHTVSEGWNIHGRTGREMADHPGRLGEARAAMEGGFPGLPIRTQQALKAIRGRVGLDYFGLDANLDPDGGVLVFEANATMNFLPRDRQMRPNSMAAVAPMVAAVRKLLLAKVAQSATKT